MRVLVALPVAVSLVAAVAGGLLRAGVSLPGEPPGDWLGQAAVGHAFLMICGFMGTVIAIERAVAVKLRWAFAGPALSAAAGLALIGGAPVFARALLLAATLAFVAVNLVVVQRQRAAHTVLLLVGALAWAAGSAVHAVQPYAGAAIAWWFAFLVLTIAAERLEMTRLMRRRRGAQPALTTMLGALLLGAALLLAWPRAGGVLYGAALVALAAWLLGFDIARRTVRAQGLSRYMAVCLLLGYGWLALAGAAWAATALGTPLRDVALHALGLGFVFSMMLAHAPVILPAVAGVKLRFGWPYYLPLAVLQASLLWRLGGVTLDASALAEGAIGNAAAIALFALTMVGSALAWQRAHAARIQRKPHHHAAENR
ncbi:MAG: hypothetical protein HS128_13345 [Ideonella sp.]|nr:hypothetical protein [Ideonella sp.]